MRRQQPRAEVLPLPLDERIAPPRVGRAVSFDHGELRVKWEGNSGRPVVARISAALDDEMLAAAAREQREVLLIFEGGDESRPVALALLRSRTPLVDAVLTSPLPRAPKNARVDGKRVAIEGDEEIVLRCGRSSLTLRRDGRVELRGVHVVNTAEGVQRIRGGKVQIN